MKELGEERDCLEILEEIGLLEGAELVTELDYEAFLEARDTGYLGGPCPCCGGKVEGCVCRDCGWDEYGGNVAYHYPDPPIL